MPRASNHPKEENFNFRVPAELKIAFQKATEGVDRPAAQVIRDFMRAYVNEHQQPEAGYDEWFRHQIQAAIDEPHFRTPHETVIKHARCTIDAIAKNKDFHED